MARSYLEEMVYVIGHNESGNSYTSINMSDVVSIGLFNWYGARALNIARQIAAADPTGSQTALAGAENPLYDQITSGNNNVWNSYKPGQYSRDVSALKLFLDLPASHTVQDGQATTDAGGYSSQAKAVGVSEPNAQIYYGDLYNQSPRQAQNIVNACKAGGKALTLDNLHAYAMANPVMSKYSTRRNWTYNELKAWTGDVPETPPVNPPNSNGGGNIPPSAYEITDYMVVVNSDTMIHFDSENPNGNVWVKAQNIWIPKITG